MDDRLPLLTVMQSATIRSAMEAIDAGTCEIALVVDERRRLLGTVTDGDIRRALLAGVSIDDPIEPIMNRHFNTVLEGSSRSEVLDLMQAWKVPQIPMVDREGKAHWATSS